MDGEDKALQHTRRSGGVLILISLVVIGLMAAVKANLGWQDHLGEPGAPKMLVYIYVTVFNAGVLCILSSVVLRQALRTSSRHLITICASVRGMWIMTAACASLDLIAGIVLAVGWGPKAYFKQHGLTDHHHPNPPYPPHGDNDGGDDDDDYGPDDSSPTLDNKTQFGLWVGICICLIILIFEAAKGAHNCKKVMYGHPGELSRLKARVAGGTILGFSCALIPLVITLWINKRNDEHSTALRVFMNFALADMVLGVICSVVILASTFTRVHYRHLSHNRFFLVLTWFASAGSVVLSLYECVDSYEHCYSQPTWDLNCNTQLGQFLAMLPYICIGVASLGTIGSTTYALVRTSALLNQEHEDVMNNRHRHRSVNDDPSYHPAPRVPTTQPTDIPAGPPPTYHQAVSQERQPLLRNG